MDPLAPQWRSWTIAPQRAGATSSSRLRLENAGGATWRSRGEAGLQVSYHWLDVRGNAIVWDGPRTALSKPVHPGETVELDISVVAPRPPGRYILRFDLVEEHCFWLSEVGVAALDVDVEVEPLIADRRLAVAVHGGADPRTTAALATQDETPVAEDAVATAHLVAGAEPASDWSRLLLDAHAGGWEAVGSAVLPTGHPLARARARKLFRAWAPGSRNPSLDAPLVLPSLVAGLEPSEHLGLPAYLGHGLFEGRAVVRLPTRSGRRRR